MSYDINFWKQKTYIDIAPQQVYEMLSAGQRVDGLFDIPVTDFLKRISEEFSDVKENPGTLDWEIEGSAFQVSWSDQHVRVDCYALPASEINKLIDIAKEFDWPLYDPQTGIRYDD